MGSRPLGELPRTTLFTPLRLRDFRFLWIGLVVSLIGDGMFFVAIAWQVYELSNAPTALSIVGVALSAPHVVLLLLGGVVSDRFDRRKVMIAADLVRAVAVALLGALALAGTIQIWHIAALAAFYGAGTAFFGPAFDALVPDLVPTNLLTQANSMDQFVRPAAWQLAGPALGGVVIGIWGVGGALLLDAATFAASIAALSMIRTRRVPSSELSAVKGIGPVYHARLEQAGITTFRQLASSSPQSVGEAAKVSLDRAQEWMRRASDRQSSVPQEIGEGFRYIRGQVWLWGTFVAAAFSYLLFLGPSEVLLPFIVKNEMGGSALDLGFILAVGGLGSIGAAFAMGNWGIPRRNITFIYACWTVSTLAVAGYGLARVPWQAMAAAFVFGSLESAGLIVWATTKQRMVPRHLLGRVSSLDWFISIGLLPLSFALTGPVAALAGARATLVGAGVLGAAVTFGFLFLPGMRAMERGELSRPIVLHPPTSQPQNMVGIAYGEDDDEIRLGA